MSGEQGDRAFGAGERGGGLESRWRAPDGPFALLAQKVCGRGRLVGGDGRVVDREVRHDNQPRHGRAVGVGRLEVGLEPRELGVVERVEVQPNQVQQACRRKEGVG